MEEITPIIKRVDHLLLRVDGAIYEQLFTLLTDLFHLPIAWLPRSYPLLRSAGVFAGNVNLELLQLEGTSIAPKGAQASLAGIALEPYDLGESIRDLKRRNIPALAPLPFAYPNEQGERQTHWTMVPLGNLLGSNQWMNVFSLVSKVLPAQFWQRASSTSNAASTQALNLLFHNGTIFLCTYNPELYAMPEGRSANRTVLHAHDGGPLGLEEVQEILVGVTNFAETNAHWHNLFVPVPASKPGVWQMGDGPAIHLVSHTQNTLLGMVWRVQSLARARTFLTQQKMLGQAQERQLTIAPETIFGLDIRLIA